VVEWKAGRRAHGSGVLPRRCSGASRLSLSDARRGTFVGEQSRAEQGEVVGVAVGVDKRKRAWLKILTSDLGGRMFLGLWNYHSSTPTPRILLASKEDFFRIPELT
jgi:hypothetical protein